MGAAVATPAGRRLVGVGVDALGIPAVRRRTRVGPLADREQRDRVIGLLAGRDLVALVAGLVAGGGDVDAGVARWHRREVVDPADAGDVDLAVVERDGRVRDRDL